MSIKQTNQLPSIIYPNLLLDRSVPHWSPCSSSPKTSNNTQNLSFHVYSSRYRNTLLHHSTLQQRLRQLHLPSIDNEENQRRRQKTNAPFRTSLLLSKPSQGIRIDLSPMVAHGVKSELSKIKAQIDAMAPSACPQAPPPSPVEGLIKHRSIESNQTRVPTPQLLPSDRSSSSSCVSYRLPALNRSARPRDTSFDAPSRRSKPVRLRTHERR